MLAPAFVDPHVHLRTPGREDEEDIDSGTRAAAAGGYCRVLAMANTDPVVDSAPVLPVSDALNFAQCGLRTFLVARSERTTTRELREAGRRIEAVGGRVDGVLFNGIKRVRFGGLNYYGYPEVA